VSTGSGGYSLSDQNGNTYTLKPLTFFGSNEYNLLSSNGAINVNVDPSIVSDIVLGGATLTIDTNFGNSVVLNTSGANGLLVFGNTEYTINGSSYINIDLETIRVGSTNGELGTNYNYNSQGQATSMCPGYLGFDQETSCSATQSSATSLLYYTNSTIGLSTPLGPISNTYMPALVVAETGTRNSGLASGETSSTVAGGLLISGGDCAVVDPFCNNYGLFYNSPAGIISGNYQPGLCTLLPASENVSALLGPWEGGAINYVPTSDPLYCAPLSDYSCSAPRLMDIDPLLIGLDGNGIQLTNWIENGVYFGTNVNASGNADGMLHHTSWVKPGTGIFAIDLNANGKIDDITETLSQFFKDGATIRSAY